MEAFEALVGGESSRSVDCSIRHQSGDVRHLRCTGVRVTDHASGAEAVEGVLTDITELWRLREALSESELRFSRTFRTAPLPSMITSFDGYYLDVSDTFCDLTGFSREDVIGKSAVDLGVWVDPADRQRLVESLRSGQCRGLEVRFRIKDSSQVLIELSARVVDIGGRKVIFSVGRDLTPVRRAEEERRLMEQHVEQAQRLESLGVLAGGIAHDFNNMLAVIAATSSLARQQLMTGAAEQAARSLEEIAHAAMQARHLTLQLLTFARGGAPQREVIALGPIVREAAGFALAGSQHRCVFEMSDDLWAVDADGGQLRQVVQNLVLNADQAMPKPGIVEVRAFNVSKPDEPIRRWVKVSVTDSGPGIPPDVATHVFDPFFTTKEHGTGLGLATAHSIVAAHGGKLELEPPSGRLGSTFSFWMPAASSEAPMARPPTSHAKVGRRLRLLVLDDQPALIKVLKSSLEAGGHRVQAVTDGQEAVAAYRTALESGERFHVVIMDLTIPGSMGGVDALKLIREFDPTVVAIAASGYSSDPVMSDYTQYGFAGRLPKPFQLADLTEAIAAALERSSSRGTVAS
jgi:PAS domain S-box-containing protein